MATARRGQVKKNEVSSTACAPSILNFVTWLEPLGKKVVNEIMSDLINKAVSETESDRSKHRGDGVSAKQLAS